jgi:predicted nucleic acid-binding Zn ribbon protein
MPIHDEDRLHTLLEEYKVCAELFMNENRVRWTRYEIHLALSSGLITVWMYFVGLRSSLLSHFGLVAIALIGISVAGTWFFMVNRGYGINDYWQWHLRRIENDLKVTRLFDEGLENEFWFGSEKQEKQPWRNRRRMRNLSQIVPFVFMLVWIVLLVLGGFLLIVKLS